MTYTVSGGALNCTQSNQYFDAVFLANWKGISKMFVKFTEVHFWDFSALE